jgi:N-succinyldiaminopimelate aminotransferase
MPRYPLTTPTADGLSDRVFGDLATRVRVRGGAIYALQVGDTYLDPPAMMRAEAQLTASHLRPHNYAPVQGEPVLLDAIVEHLETRGGRAVDRELVQVTNGGTGALSALAQTLLDPNDEVLLPSPYWPLARGIFAARGAVPVQVPLFTRLDETDFDAERALEAAVTPRTTAIYVNTPNNPTGRILPPAVLAAIARVAAKHQLWIVCDEAYEELWFGDVAPAPAWARDDFRARSVAIHTLSKGYGYAGARIGFVHGPPEAMRVFRSVNTFHTYCAPRPFQLGAARAMREAGDWLRHARALYREAGKRAAEKFGVPAPEGGTFLFVDIARHLRAGEASCSPFLERALDLGVWLTPGSASGRDFPTHIRLCFTAVAPSTLDEALRALKPLLQR